MLGLDFVGEWQLIDFVTVLADGRRIEPLGADPVGVGVYTRQGWMSAHLMRRDRAPFGEGCRPGVDAIESEILLGAAAGYIGYAGRWTVDHAARRISHHVEMAFIPDWVGTVLEREFAFEDGVLSLSPPAVRGVRSTLRWCRRR